MRISLALLPMLMFALTAAACRARAESTVGAIRLSLIRAAIVVGAYGILSVELLSAVNTITLPGSLAVWLIGIAAAVAALVVRERGRVAGLAACARDAGKGLTERWSALGWPDQLMLVAFLGITALELVIALVARPSNFDSMTYHLPRIEHWVQQQNLDHYPTAIGRQLVFPPGAEYHLLHTRLLTGGDALYNLLQWAGALGAALVASRIAAQLGAAARGQLLAALTVATIPMVVLQASSTQTDVIVGFWVLAAAMIAVDGLTRRVTVAEPVLLGLATGLVAVTKTSGLIALAPILVVWGLAQLRLGWGSGRWRGLLQRTAWTALASVVVLGLMVLLAGPAAHRVDQTFGSPSGPQQEALIPKRHDPAALTVNAARLVTTALMTEYPSINNKLVGATRHLARLLDVDVNDPDITFSNTKYPVVTYVPDEDYASYPIQAVAIFFAVLAALIGRRRPGPVRAYGAAVAVGALLFMALLRWQPWSNRLLVPMVVLGAPLVGWAGGRLFEWQPSRAWLRKASVVLTAVAVFCAVQGAIDAILHGVPRGLSGQRSVLSVSEMQTRFLRSRWRQQPYQAAAAQVRAANAQTVGLVQSTDSWEYPWWVLLRDGDGNPPEMVDLSSRQAAKPSPSVSAAGVDAIICTETVEKCVAATPAGWQRTTYDGVSVILPS